MINYIIFGNSLLNPVIKMWNVSENIRFAHATWLDKVCHANQLTIPYQGASRVTLKMIFPIKITFLPQFFFLQNPYMAASSVYAGKSTHVPFKNVSIVNIISAFLRVNGFHFKSLEELWWNRLNLKWPTKYSSCVFVSIRVHCFKSTRTENHVYTVDSESEKF